MATKTDANGNIVSFALDTKDTYIGEKMTFNINVTTAGIDTSDADATAEDIKAGKTAYVNGELIEGTHTEQVFTTEEKTVTPTKSVQEITPLTADGLSKVTINAIPNEYIVTSDADAQAQNIQRGYTAYVNGVKITGTHDEGTFSTEEKTATPTESVQYITPTSADGLSKVTVSAISSTYVGSGVTRKAAATITPGTTNQTISADTYLTGTQTISGDSNLVAGNIKAGVNIFGVGGTFTADADATANNIQRGKTAYVNGVKITGTHDEATFTTEEKTVNPQETSVEVVPTGADGLSKVTVNPISSTYVGSGVTQKTAATYTPGTADQTIAASQYLSGAQTIKGDANLTADNIAKDVTIFGVTGTHEGGIDTTDATATAEDIAKDKTAYVNGVKITGTKTDDGQSYYTGEDAPTTDLGSDGDIYFKTSGGSGSGTSTTGTEVGTLNATNNTISLTDSSLASGTYTLYYEDASGTKLDKWAEIGSISK